MQKIPNNCGRALAYLLVLLVGFATWPMVGPAAAQDTATGQNTADTGSGGPTGKPSKQGTLRMLNKLTMEIVQDKMAVGSERKFGKLRIKMFACYQRAGDDAVAFLQIWDGGQQARNPDATKETVAVKNAAGETRVFSGWMFSTYPALNPLDHAIYDIWVVDCK